MTLHDFAEFIIGKPPSDHALGAVANRLWQLASIRNDALNGRYRMHSRHWPALALNGSVANDPSATYGVEPETA